LDGAWKNDPHGIKTSLNAELAATPFHRRASSFTLAFEPLS
jgi:hypothetical protein